MVRDPTAEWLTGIVLGAAEALPSRDEASLKLLDTIQCNSGARYPIYVNQDGKPLAKSDRYTLYVALLPNGQYGLMKISSKEETEIANAALRKEAQILESVRREARRADREAQVQGKWPYNYDAFFPRVIDSRTATDGRQVFILGYHEAIESIKHLSPLSMVLRPDTTRRHRVDLKTVTWILGKTLKVLGFAHSLGIYNRLVNLSNVLIEPELHGVILLDWTKADYDTCDNKVSLESQRREVAAAAHCVWQIAGGSESEEPPFDAHIVTQYQHREYLDYLLRMKRGANDGAYDEHARLYAMADRFWPKVEEGGVVKRQFHHFQTYPI